MQSVADVGLTIFRATPCSQKVLSTKASGTKNRNTSEANLVRMTACQSAGRYGGRMKLIFVTLCRIPLGDNLLEITASLPENELTAVLRDFRQYRPPTQREYIESVEARARIAKVKAFAHADLKSLALYVLNVDQVRSYVTCSIGCFSF
jgi:hypothetical protein